MGKVMAVNISVKRGTQKVNVHTVKLIENYGLENDAHAGNWHRQVSLLSYEKIEEFKAKGAPVKDGAFGENLIVQGFDFKTLPVGTRLKCNDADWKAVSQRLRDFQDHGRLHYAPRRCFCQSNQRRCDL